MTVGTSRNVTRALLHANDQIKFRDDSLSMKTLAFWTFRALPKPLSNLIPNMAYHENYYMQISVRTGHSGERFGGHLLVVRDVEKLIAFSAISWGQDITLKSQSNRFSGTINFYQNRMMSSTATAAEVHNLVFSLRSLRSNQQFSEGAHYCQ